jgi:hypothetical protein
MKNASAGKTDAENSGNEPQTPEELSERRRHPDSKARDRRVIARFSDSGLRFQMTQIHRLCKIWVGFAIFFAATVIGVQFYNDWRTSQRAIFYGAIVLTMAYSIYRVSLAAASYTENESQARMGKFVESCFFMFIAVAIISVVFGVSYIITLF